MNFEFLVIIDNNEIVMYLVLICNKTDHDFLSWMEKCICIGTRYGILNTKFKLPDQFWTIWKSQNGL